jgi:hypothetical protein
VNSSVLSAADYFIAKPYLIKVNGVKKIHQKANLCHVFFKYPVYIETGGI